MEKLFEEKQNNARLVERVFEKAGTLTTAERRQRATLHILEWM